MEIPACRLPGLTSAFLLLMLVPRAAAQQSPLQIKSFSVGPDQILSYPSLLVNIPDEHTTLMPLASSIGPYLLFGASKTAGADTTGGAVVLETTDFFNFSFPAPLGYTPQVMTPPTPIDQCNPAYVTEFDGNYAAPGSVVQDPTLPPGSFIMIYEAENHCPGGVLNMPYYAAVGFARSSDSGKTWPAPINGVLGGPARHPVLQSSDPQPSIPHSSEGDAIPSAFVDLDADQNYYLYVTYGYPPASGNGDGLVRVARARLGTDPLVFEKWYNGSFSQPGIGGSDTGVTPSAGCANGSQVHSEINYNDDLGLYLLIFVCTNGTASSRVSAWYYSTATSLDLQNWTTPHMIQNSQFPNTFPCSGLTSGEQFDGWYPSTVSPGAAAAHTRLTGYFFFQNGCDVGPRQFNSRTFTIVAAPGPPGSCTYSLSPGGQVFSSLGGTGSITINTDAGCPWSVGPLPSWVALTGVSSGIGSGAVTFQILSDGSGDLAGTFTIAGQAFTIGQLAASIPGLKFTGSMPHLAAEGGWNTTFTFVNKNDVSATARNSFFASGGSALTLPVDLPQQPAIAASLLASSLDQTIVPNGSFVLVATGPASVPYLEGSAQLAATGSVDGFAIFHFDPSQQEAVVPLETRNAPSYLLAFDDTNSLVTGVAVGNASSQAANIRVVLRDDTGKTIGTGSIPLNGNGHTSFLLSTQFPVTANIRGTVEFDTPAGGQISVLGIRFTPPGTFTTIPALANVGTSGGLMAHLASGNGWETTFVLINTGVIAAQAQLSFFADNGSPLLLPLTFPQSNGGSPATVSSLSQTIAAGASLWVQSAGPVTSALLTGSAQLSTSGNISGFVIFRYNPNGQEALVPLESRNADSYVLAFDNTNNTATGVAINVVSSQNVSIPLTIRDAAGNQIGTESIPLNANGHTSFVLASQYPGTSGIRGTLEFTAPTSAPISVLGIRSPPAMTFTTLPPLAK
jgi:hypothetical protein